MPLSPITSTQRLALLAMVVWTMTCGFATQLQADSPPSGKLDDSATIKVNFPNTPILAIVPFYTEITGKKIILDSSLQGEPLRIIAPPCVDHRTRERFFICDHRKRAIDRAV